MPVLAQEIPCGKKSAGEVCNGLSGRVNGTVALDGLGQILEGNDFSDH
jgi:hypothetical protein